MTHRADDMLIVLLREEGLLTEEESAGNRRSGSRQRMRWSCSQLCTREREQAMEREE